MARFVRFDDVVDLRRSCLRPYALRRLATDRIVAIAKTLTHVE